MGAAAAHPLRIAVCAPYDLALPGGVNSHIRAQAAALRRRGHDVCVFGASSSPLHDGELALGTCRSFVIAGTETGLSFDPRSRQRVADLLQPGRFDILHMHEPLMPLLPWFALWYSSAPIVATFHTHREEGHRLYARHRWLLAPLMRRVQMRIAVSDAAKRTVAHQFPGDYEVVPNGIDIERFRRPMPSPPAMPPGHRHILFVGRLEPRKGVDVLIRAVATIQDVAPDARLVIVGDGPNRASLEALAHQMDVEATFTGRVPDDGLPAYYQAADVVCSPALGGESFGIVLLEGMACGKPIVASHIDGYVGLMEGADCGRLVPPGDVDALAHALASMLQSATAGRMLGAHGAAAALAYDWSAVAERLETIYGKVLPAVTG